MSIAEQILRAKADYDAVHEAAYSEGIKAARKAMWDGLLYSGERTNLNFAFYCPDESKPIWTDDTFDPPYDIRPEQANRMFRGFGVTNLPALLKNLGDRELDFSNCTSMPYVFSNSESLKVCSKIVVNKNCKDLDHTFADCPILETIEIELQEGCNTKWTSTFIRDSNLKNVTITGDWIRNSINLQWSKDLTVKSAQNIMLQLYQDVDGQFLGRPTVKFAEEVWEKLDAQGHVVGEGCFDAMEDPGELLTWRDFLDFIGWSY